MVTSRSLVRGDSLAGAIATTVAYCDIFAFAPQARELHRYLIGRRATRAEVRRELASNPGLARLLSEVDGYWCFRGKEHLVPRRLRFARHSAALWPRAHRIAAAVERTGLASCGMVTGSLAAENADEHADIDFLLVYPTPRTYVSFAALRLLQTVPGSGLTKMCPNYALSEAKLEIRPQNLFTAWEIAKAVPMFGFEVYARFVHANRWVQRYLPNALPALDPRDTGVEPPAPRLRGLLDRLAASGPLQRLEALERGRKQRADVRDVGVDMKSRNAQGSMDRHSPTRPFHTLSELRYRMDQHGLVDHSLYEEIAASTRPLEAEMSRWGEAPITTAEAETVPEAEAQVTGAA